MLTFAVLALVLPKFGNLFGISSSSSINFDKIMGDLNVVVQA